ncbi:Translation_initiation factor eIF3 subunit [Hexamita inflata]|uniref:Translation_initiation factor eIF3 subunit n=1 Tax=Hexamita inflata TaxID=28002 RepID=A0ABP1HCA6_9EUKA
MDFSFSEEDGQPAEKQDWEIEAEQAELAQAQALQEAERLKQEELEKQNQEELRNRSRETCNVEIELDEEARIRLERRKREEQNVRLAQKFMQDSDSEDEKAEKGQKKSIKRNYDLENEFFAVEKKKEVEGEEKEEKMPTTQADFEKFADSLITKITSTHKRGQKQDNDVLYMMMLKRLVRGVLKPLYLEDAKELADVCAQVANEQIGANKASKKGVAKKAKNSKPAVSTHEEDEWM